MFINVPGISLDRKAFSASRANACEQKESQMDVTKLTEVSRNYTNAPNVHNLLRVVR
jgi:hypothetical protein